MRFIYSSVSYLVLRYSDLCTVCEPIHEIFGTYRTCHGVNSFLNMHSHLRSGSTYLRFWSEPSTTYVHMYVTGSDGSGETGWMRRLI